MTITIGKCRASAAAAILLLTAAACKDVPTTAPAAAILISVQTLGGDPDPDGYQVVVGWEKRNLPLNSSTTFSGLPAGAYWVALEGVADNCAVEEDVARIITVADGDVLAVRFVVSCAMTGIEITTRTTGFRNIHGYLVSVDGGEEARTDSSGRLVISRLQPGIHTVEIDPGRDCKLAGPRDLTVEVKNRSLTTVSIEATCAPPAAVTFHFGNLFDCGDPDQDPTRFRDGLGSSEVTLRVGATVEWVYDSYMHPACTARIVSTLVPAGGASIDSGILKPGESFKFVPAVAGTWRFTDLISGGSGALIVLELP